MTRPLSSLGRVVVVLAERTLLNGTGSASWYTLRRSQILETVLPDVAGPAPLSVAVTSTTEGREPNA